MLMSTHPAQKPSHTRRYEIYMGLLIWGGAAAVLIGLLYIGSLLSGD